MASVSPVNYPHTQVTHGLFLGGGKGIIIDFNEQVWCYKTKQKISSNLLGCDSGPAIMY